MRKSKTKIKNELRVKIIATVVLGIFFALYSYMPALIAFRGRYYAKKHNSSNVLGLSIFRLPVKYHKQEHSLSCEIASLKMALNGVGIEVEEGELIRRLKFDPTPKTKGVWGNPYTGFVGDIDGKMGKTGYGVYWQPIADVGNGYTYSEVIQNASPEELAEHLLKGRPIVWWGFFGRGKKISWQTKEGLNIQAIDGEHARTLVGFAGSKESPEGFFIFDPIYGEMFLKTEELVKNSEPFNNSGVVVYPRDVLFGV